MKSLIFVLIILSFVIPVKAQTVTYTYNTGGGCTSRVLKVSNQKKSIDKGNRDIKLDEISSQIDYNKDANRITVIVSTSNSNPKLSFAFSDITGVVIMRGPLEVGENVLILSDLKRNIYILNLYGENYAESYKLIKD